MLTHPLCPGLPVAYTGLIPRDPHDAALNHWRRAGWSAVQVSTRIQLSRCQGGLSTSPGEWSYCDECGFIVYRVVYDLS